AAQHTGRLGQFQPDRHHLATVQESAQSSLTAGVTPRLPHDDGGDEQASPLFDGQVVDRPHPSIILIDGNQGAGVVDVRDAHAAADRDALMAWASAAAISARAAASSSAVNAPCSACQSATSLRPT